MRTRMLVLGLVAVLGLWAPAWAAAPLIFVDANDNGVYDAGDTDVTQTVLATGAVSTPLSLVVPVGAYLRVRAPAMDLHAGNAIHINGSVWLSGSQLGVMRLRTDTGPITIGLRSLVLSAAGHMQLTAGGDLVIHGSRVQGNGIVMLESLNGDITIRRGILGGAARMEINGYSQTANLDVEDTTMRSIHGLVNLHVEGIVNVVRTSLLADDLNIAAGGGAAEVLASVLRVTRNGTVFLSVSPSPAAPLAPTTLDITGTRIYAPEGSVVLHADVVTGP